MGEAARRARGSAPSTGGLVDMSDKNNDDSQESRQASREEDAALMARVAADDQEAIAALYDRFVSLVFRMAVQALPTRPEAEDAVQEVFLRLWRTADRFDAERAATQCDSTSTTPTKERAGVAPAARLSASTQPQPAETLRVALPDRCIRLQKELAKLWTLSPISLAWRRASDPAGRAHG